MSPLATLRQAAWLDVPRATAYARMLLALGAVLTIGLYAAILLPAFQGPNHRPLGSDFDTFWAGARLALRGQAASAYDPHAIAAAEALGAQLQPGQFYAYLYPPTFLALSLPLGTLPYLLALPLFLVTGYAALLTSLRRLLPAPWPLVGLLAFPAAMLNAVVGQNGFATAACFGWAAVLLDRQPRLAGACLGLLVCKPHLAIGVPIALLAARRWSALASCAMVAAGLILLSWLLLGTPTWHAFLSATPLAHAMLDDREIWAKTLSLYAAARLLGASPAIAFGLQMLLGASSLAVLARVSWHRPSGTALVSAIVAATMLCSPYIWDYDQVCLAIPLAWLAALGARQGFLAWEKLALAALFLLPVIARAMNLGLGVPIAPFLLVGLLGLTARRASLA